MNNDPISREELVKNPLDRRATKKRWQTAVWKAFLSTTRRFCVKPPIDCDAWKRRAEAAEQDIAAMLTNCECEIRHEYCVGCNGKSDDCREYAIWRGPCAGNGGVDI